MKVFLISVAICFLLGLIAKYQIYSMTDKEVIHAKFTGRYPYRVCVFIILWWLSVIECIVSFIIWMINL